MFAQLRDHLAYRLFLAGIAGCLAAWIFLPEDFFPVPSGPTDFFLPGTVFGLLVLVPLIKNPISDWVRSTLLLCAATLAHFAMWATGLSMVDVLDALQWDEDGFISVAGILVLLGGTSGLVFGMIVTLAATRALTIRFDRNMWITVALMSVFGGTFFAGIILNRLGVLSDVLRESSISDFRIYVAYVVLYLIYAIVFALGKHRQIEKPTRTDLVLLGGLVLLISLSAAWIASL